MDPLLLNKTNNESISTHPFGVDKERKLSKNLFEEDLITTKNAARLSGYTSDYLARLVRAGKISGKMIGHSWLVDRRSLVRFLDQQENQKVDRVRAIAHERAQEYRVHLSRVRRTTETLLTPIIAPQSLSMGSGIPMRELRAHTLAFSVALLVVVFGAFVAHTPVVPTLATNTMTIIEKISSGFNGSFDDTLFRIALRVDTAKVSMRTSSLHAAMAHAVASTHLTLPFLTEPDLSSLRMSFPKKISAHSIPTTVSTKTVFADTAPLFTIKKWQSLISDGYTLLTSPLRITNALANMYIVAGEKTYAGITSSFSAYDALITQLGIQQLALALTTRDVLKAAPHSIGRIHLALGTAIIEATHTLIRADVATAYAIAALAPESARVTYALIGNVGNILARATERVPARATSFFLRATRAPADIAPVFAQKVFDAEYAGAMYFIAFTETLSKQYLAFVLDTGHLVYMGSVRARSLAHVPTVLKDIYLGTLGKGALAFVSLKQMPQVVQDSQESLGSLGFAAVFAAALPVLSIGEQIALTSYETIHSFFSSTSRTLAALFAPPPTIVPPVVNRIEPPKPIVVATSTSNAPRTVVTNYPTYNTTHTTVVRGVSEDFIKESQATLRTDILGTVAGMIRPVATQGVTNTNTIQYVNMIQDLSNLIVRNGDFRGGSLTNGTSISATTGSFTNLSASGATTLSGLTISGSATSTSNVGYDITTGCFAINGTCLSTSGGVTSLGPTGQSLTGAVDIATSSTAFNGLTASTTVTGSGQTLTFTNTLAGLLGVGGGGTGSTTLTGILKGNGTSAVGTLLIGSGLTYDGTTLTGTAGSNYWTANSNDIFNNNTGSVGIGTSTPWATLSVASANASTLKPLFVVASSSAGVATSTLFLINGNGNVGIGTTSPWGILSVSASTTNPLLALTQYGSSTATSGPLISFNFGSTTNANIASEFGNVRGDISWTGTYNTTGTAFNVAISGRYAYVADSASGLQVIDIANPAAPILMGTYNTTGNASAIAVSGRYAYVADDTSGLQIIDIANPTLPTLVGTYNTSGLAVGIAISGRYAYVADLTSGLHIIDIANPATPSLVGTYNTSGGAYSVALSGRYAYVADGISGLQIIDIANPTLPTLVGTYNTTGTALGIAISGRYAYVADDTSGLHIIDIANPTTPTLVGTYDTSGTASGIAISGRYAYVADDTPGLHIIDIASSTAPTLVGTYNTTGLAYGIALSGRYVYVADQGSGLQILSLPGIDMPNAQIGNIQSSDITTWNGIDVGTNLNVRGGVNIGNGGLFAQGAGGFMLFATTSLSSVTALSAQLTDSNNSSIVDVLSIDHSATTTGAQVSSGIGAGLLFTLQTVATTSTSTNRIASILTNVSTTSPASALTFYGKNSSAGLTEFMRLDSTGNLGIGTTSPYARLSISNSATTPVNTPLFTIASTTGGTSTTTLMTVLAGGQMLLGTSTPPVAAANAAASLAVFPVVPGSNSAFFVGAQSTGSEWFSVGTQGAGVVQFNAAGGTTQAGGVNLGARFNIAPVSDSLPTLAIRGYTGGVSDIFRVSSPATTVGDYLNIKSTGNVGIGTTSPYSLLSISNNATTPVNTSLFTIASTTGGTSTTTLMTVNSIGQILLQNGATLAPSYSFANYPTSGLRANGDGGFSFIVAGILKLAMYADSWRFPVGSVSLNDSTTGNRVLGFTAGNAVANSSTNSVDIKNAATGGNPLVSVKGGDANVSLDIAALGTGSVNVTNGNLGVGTTTPWAKLSVGTHNLAITSPSFVIASSSTGVATSTQFIVVNGNVGIGTTTPVYKLDIIGLAATDAIRTEIGLDIKTVTNLTGSVALAGAGVGNVDDGVHYYWVTFVTALGETGLMATSPTTVTVVDKTVNGQVTVTLPVSSDHRVTARKIYRSRVSDGTANYYNSHLVATVSNNTDTTYTDNIADTSLATDNSYWRENTTSKQITLNGSPAIFIGSGVEQSVAVGLNAGATIAAGTAIGGASTLVGYGAGDVITTGSKNNAFGYNTLGSVTTGSGNVGFGWGALSGVTTGSFNVAIGGQGAGANNQTGLFNTIVGYNAGLGVSANNNNYNSAFGGGSLNGITTGNYNVVMGYLAGYNITTGQKNILIGSMSAVGNANLTTGSNNIGIGTDISFVSSTDSNQLNIQNIIFGTGNAGASTTPSTGKIGIGTTTPYSLLSISNSATTAGGTPLFTIASTTLGTATSTLMTVLNSGNVGIGTTSPSAKIEIVATGASVDSLRISNNNGTQNDTNYISFNQNVVMEYARVMGTAEDTTIGRLSFWTKNGSIAERMRIANNGNVGIGTTSPATLFEVGGTTANVTFDGYKNCTGFTSNANGLLACTASDERMKQNIVALDTASGLDAISALNPVSFYWNPATERGSQQQFGLIAQQVQTVFPNLVTVSNPTALTPNGMLSVNYVGLISPMIRAIQELNARIEAQASSTAITIISLEDRVAKLEGGMITIASGSPITFSTTSLVSALNSFGVFIQKGIAQFTLLIGDQFVAATNSAGMSSAGTVTILAGNTVAQVNNTYVKPSSKIFVTLTAPTTGSWYISDKQNGSFKLVLSAPQESDVSFDYFLVQTEGQIATSTPEVAEPTATTSGSSATPTIVTPPGEGSQISSTTTPSVPVPDSTNLGVSPPSTGSGTTSPTITSTTTSTDSSTSTAIDTVPPVVTLTGAAAMEIQAGESFTDPGATATDDTDGDLTSHIIVTGAVDTTTAGLYTLTYSVTDAALNNSSVSRAVIVLAPVISIPDLITATSTMPPAGEAALTP